MRRVFSICYESRGSPEPDKVGTIKIPILERKKQRLRGPHHAGGKW